VKVHEQVTCPPLPPPEQPSTNLPVVKLALREVFPPVERKLKLPPAQVLAAVCGQLMLKLPAGEATDELMMTPELTEVDPPEFVKLP
jgi:hypothetical protein